MTRRTLTPALVIDVAAALADRDGFDAIVVSAVAEKLGVRSASLYGHVRDRQAILAGVQKLAMNELADTIGAAIAGRSRAEALFAMGEAQRRYARERPGCWESLQRRAEAGVPQSDESSRVATLALAVLRGYGLADHDAVHAVRVAGAAIGGFIGLERTGAFDHRYHDVEESWRRTIDMLDGAFASWGAAA